MSHYAMYTDFDALEAAQIEEAERYAEEGEIEEMKENLNLVNYSTKIANSIIDYFKSEQWSYEFERENGIIQISFNVALKIKELKHIIAVEKKGFLFNTYIPLNGDMTSKGKIAELFNLINNDIKIGKFSIDYEDGEIKFSSYTECGDTYLSLEDIKFKIMLHEFMYTQYEEALLAVMFQLKTPEQAYKDIK